MCVKVNFDYSIRDARGGVGYVIKDSDSRLLVVGGSCIFKPYILKPNLEMPKRVSYMSSRSCEQREFLLRKILPPSLLKFRIK